MAAPRGNKNHFGKKVSIEGRDKMRSARLKNPNKYWLGKSRSQETREKISKSKVGKDSPKKGKIFPEQWGEKSKLWKGGTLSNNGYMVICVGRKKKLLHRYLMEILLGRELLETEEVHHKDGNKTNNDIQNLELIDWIEHRRMHARI